MQELKLLKRGCVRTTDIGSTCLSTFGFHKTIFEPTGFMNQSVWQLQLNMRFQIMIDTISIQVDSMFFWQPSSTLLRFTTYQALAEDTVQRYEGHRKKLQPTANFFQGIARGLCTLLLHFVVRCCVDSLCWCALQFGWKSLLCLALLPWLGPAWCVSSARSHGVRAARRVVDTLVQFLCYEDSVRPRCSQRGCRCQVLQWSRAECLGTGHGEADWHWRSIFHLGAGSEGSCGARDEGSWAEQQQWWRHARLGPPRRKRTEEEGLSDKVKFINKNSLENGLPDPCPDWLPGIGMCSLYFFNPAQSSARQSLSLVY